VNAAIINLHKGLVLKIAILWLATFFLAGFLVSIRSAASPVTLSIIANRLSSTNYELYVNGKLMEEGSATIAPRSTSQHQYAYENSLERGSQVNFVLRTSSDSGSFSKMVSLPKYPPQLMSSFISLAAFSTSVMSSMVSMQYFNDAFGAASRVNAGVIVTLVLMALLIFLELTQTTTISEKTTIMGSYRVSFRDVSNILFIIFVGIVLTKVVVLILSL
jgi:hypothetical protein